MSKQVIAYGSDQTFSLPSTIISSCSHIGQEPTNSSSQPGGNSPPNNGYLVSKLTPNKHKQPYHRVSCLHPWGWTELNPYDPKPPEKCDSDYAWHPLRHAALVAIENAAARDRSLFPNPASSIKHSTSMDNLLQPDDIPSKRLKTNTPEVIVLPFLCCSPSFSGKRNSVLAIDII